MSDNTGKKLREANEENFDSTPVNSKQDKQHTFNADPFSKRGVDQLGEATRVSNAGKSFSQDAIFDSPFKDDYFNSKMLGFDLGSVTGGIENDPNSLVSVTNRNMDMDKFRSDNQSAVSKTANIATSFIGKTGVNILGNITGTLYGVGVYAKDVLDPDKEAKAMSIIDNSWTREMDDWMKSIDNANTVFVDPSSTMGFNAKTFKEIADAYAFTVGAVMTELAMNTVGNLAGGAGTATLPARIARYLPRIGKMFRAGDKMFEGVEKATKAAYNLEKTVDKMSKLKRARDILSAVGGGIGSFGRRALTTTGYESGLMARQVKDELMARQVADLEEYLSTADMTQEEKDLYRRNKMEEITNAADSAGLFTFGLTSAVLNVGNMIQFPSVFGNSYVKFKNLNKINRAGLGEAATAKGKRAFTKKYAKHGLRLLKNPATEFMEETSQGVISNFADNQYEVMLGTRTQAGVLAPNVNQTAYNFHKALEETYGTSEGLHEGYIGAIVGMLGVPGLKKHGKGITIHGGIAQGIRDIKQYEKNTQEALESVKTADIKSAVNYRVDDAILTALDSEEEQIATDMGNKFAFEGVKDNRTYRYTINRLNHGLEEHIDEDIKEMKELAESNMDQYRATFGKTEEFSKEDALDEIQKFEDKVNIYKRAHKVVNKRFNENLLKKDDKHKKMVDMVTYAVATGEITMKQRDDLIKQLHERFNGEFTDEELKEFFNTSAKVAKLKKPLQSYVQDKNDDRLEDHFTDPEYLTIKKEIEEARDKEVKKETGLSYEEFEKKIDELKAKKAKLEKEGKSKEEILKEDPEIEALDTMYELTDPYNLKLSEHETAHQKKFEPFQYKKSSKVRPALYKLDEINKEIEESASKQMKAISEPASKMTPSELDNFLKTKQKIIDNVNKENQSEGLLDRMERLKEDENIDELLRKVSEIGDRMTNALAVAQYLYGFKNNLSSAYSNIAIGEFYANFKNTERLYQVTRMMFETGDDMVDVEGKLTELKDVLDITKESFFESIPKIAKETSSAFVMEMTNEIQELEDDVNKLEKRIETWKQKKKDTKQTIKNSTKKDDVASTEQVNKDLKDESKEDDTYEDEEDDDGTGDKSPEDIANKYGLSIGSNKDDDDSSKSKKPSDKNKEKDTDKDDEEPGKSPEDLRKRLEENDDEDSSEPSKSTKKKKPKSKGKKSKQSGSANKKIAMNEDNRRNTFTLKEGDKFTKKKSGKGFDLLLKYQNAKGEKVNGFKEKAAAMWQLKEVDPEKNPEFKNWFLNGEYKDKYDSYVRGLEKVKNDPSLVDEKVPIDEMDEDAYTLIRFAPVRMEIYDHVLSKKDNYQFNFDEVGDPIYKHEYMFSPDDIKDYDLRNAQEAEAYEEEMAEEKTRHKEAMAKLKKLEQETSKERSYHLSEKQRIKDKYVNWGHNSETNFAFRRSLLRGFFYKGNDRLKLRVDYVNMGDFQRKYYHDAESGVQERNVSELGYDASKMELTDIFYATNNNESHNFRSITGIPAADLDNPIDFDSRDDFAVAGSVYFRYVNDAGKHVPIKMNTKKIGEKYANFILDEIERYLEDPESYKVGKTDIPFRNKSDMKIQDMLDFFLNKQKGNSKNMSMVKNTYSVDESGPKPEVRLHLGLSSTVHLKNAEDIASLKQELVENLKEQRFFIHKSAITKTNAKGVMSLDRTMLEFLFKNKIINHNFENGTPYKTDQKRSIVLSTASSKVDRTKMRTYPKFNQLVVKLKKAILGKVTSKYEFDDIQLITKMIKHITDKFAKEKGIIIDAYNNENLQNQLNDLSDEDANKMMNAIIDEVVQLNVNKVHRIAKEKPGMIHNDDHRTNFEIQDNDTAFDISLRMIYAFKKYAKHDRSMFIEKGKESADLSDARRKTSALFTNHKTRKYNVNEYRTHKERKSASPTLVINSQEEFDMIYEHARYLQSLTQSKGSTVFIDYTDDHAGYGSASTKGKPTGFNRVHESNQKETTLYKVTIDKNPKFEPGEDGGPGRVVGGSIKLHFEIKDQAGNVINRTTKTLLHNSEEELKTNLITRLATPFINPDGSYDYEESNKYFDRLSQRDSVRNEINDKAIKSVRRRLNNEIADLMQSYKGNDADLYKDDTEDDDGPKAETPDEKDTTKTTSQPDTVDFDDETLYSEDAVKEMNRLVGLILDLQEKNKSNPKLVDFIVSKIERAFDIVTDAEFNELYRQYEKRGLLGNNKSGEGSLAGNKDKIDSFAKQHLETESTPDMNPDSCNNKK